MGNIEEFKKDLKDSVSKNKLEEVLDKLIEQTNPSSKISHDAYSQKGKLAHLEEKRISGIISEDGEKLSINQIRDSILKIINTLETFDLKNFYEDLDDETKNSKNFKRNDNKTAYIEKSILKHRYIEEIKYFFENCFVRGFTYLDRNDVVYLQLYKNILVYLDRNDNLVVEHLVELRRKFDDTYWKTKSLAEEYSYVVKMPLQFISEVKVFDGISGTVDFFKEDIFTIALFSKNNDNLINTFTLRANYEDKYSFYEDEYETENEYYEPLYDVEFYLSNKKANKEELLSSFEELLKIFR